jgi:hypothetical protein
MKYMMLIYFDEKQLNDEDRESCYVESKALAHDLQRDGMYMDASPLQPVAMATSVRLREGRRFVTDGPFAETHEQLGGYYLVDAPNLDRAIEIASKIPAVLYGTVEIRPLIELSGLPE